jgi:putative ABC transport system permease protein
VWRATWRTALAHKGRLALSALAVVLGVAFVAGTYVFTDTLQRTFSDLFEGVEPDVIVTAAAEFDTQQTTGAVASLPAAALDVLADVDGVAKAAGVVQVTGVTLLDEDGQIVGAPGAPAFGVNWDDDADLSPLRLVEGRGPAAPDEVAIDTQAYESGGFALGDTIRILTPGPTEQAELVGVFRYGTSGNLAGATLTAFQPRRAQELLLGGDRWTEVRAVGDGTLSQDQLAERTSASFADADDRAGEVLVRTGEQAADEATDSLTEGLGFITTFLLVFAGVALFVGAFIIVNTFSVLIARRTRELGLLRTVGATRRQVFWSVMVEAFLVGLVGGVVGLALGIGLAIALRELFGVIGFDIPAGSLVVAPRTVLAAIGVGVGLTVVAAVVPAWRAGRVPPMAALRDDVVLPTRSLRVRTVAGTALALLGAGLLAVGLVGDVRNGIALVGAGILLVFLAVALLAAVIGGAVIAVLGRPVTRTTVGRLAVRNAQRDRRRTAATASALMIGLALVSMIGVLGASASRSIEASIAEVIRADYIVSSITFQPFSPAIGDALEDVAGVAVVSRVAVSPARIGSGEDPSAVQVGRGASSVTAVDPSTIADVVNVTVIDGAVQSLTDGAVAVDPDTAEVEGLQVGSTITITWPSGPRDYQVGAILEQTGPLTGVVIDRDELVGLGLGDQDAQLFVQAADRDQAADLRADLEAALAAYPVVELLDQTQFADQVRGQVNQLLSLVYALLGLAVVIAILGIVNTLVLSVLERTREIGLLRAVGMARTQIRRVVRIEAVLIAMFGALLGVGLGVAFGVAVQQSIADEGVDLLAIPWNIIVTVLVTSALVGVLAAIIPARRAARLDVLAAIATE